MESYSQLSFTEQAKRCTQCGEVKPFTEFHRDRTKPTGHTNSCKACAINRAQVWYRDNHERGLETRRQYGRVHKSEKAEMDRQYREANRDALREKKYVAYHRDKHKYEERRRAYSEATREATRERSREYRRNHPERVRHNNYLRKARMTWARDEAAIAFAKVLRRDPCSYCGKPGGTIDHIVPIAHGGIHEVDNLAAACLQCNTSKATQSALYFLHRTQRRGD
jgi:5-methylcytosine-specific restriction endonuclease McrA